MENDCPICGGVLETGFMFEEHDSCAVEALRRFMESVRAIQWPNRAKYYERRCLT